MGSLPALSILKGPQEVLKRKDEPILLQQIFEHTIQSIDSVNNNNDKIPVIHGITVREGIPEIIFGEKVLSISEINEEANQLARAIQQDYAAELNSDGDTVVAVDLTPSPALVTTLLAIWKLNAAYLPLDAAFPDQRVHHILSESQPSLIICENDNKQRYQSYPVATISKLKTISRNLSGENLVSPWARPACPEEQIAIILYTSGSTGVPKGVRLPHRVILNRLKWQWKTFPYSATEKVCVFKTALTFVDSVAELWGPLLSGRSVLILSKAQVIDTETFIAAMDKYKVERLVLVPTLLRSILLYIGMVSNEKTPFRAAENVKTKRHLSSLKFWVCSGEELPVSLAQKFYQFFPENEHTLLNFYGSTEVMADVLYYPVKRVHGLSPSEKVAIGQPMDNTNIYILDKHFRPVSFGEVGELFVSGLNLAAGYVRGRDPDRFIDNPLAIDQVHSKMYKTGDYARVEKGIVFFEGRTDSQIKIRGHKVDLSEVEAAITKVSDIDKFVVLAYKAGQIDQALLAFVTVKSVEANARSLEERLEGLLPPYMVPQVVVVPNIPLLVNGKVDRQFLLRQYEEKFKKDAWERVEFDYAGLPNGSHAKAKALYETVALTLGHSLKGRITATSNYYHLGGNSLNSVLAVTKLRDLGYVISIGDFISATSLSEIVRRMQEEETMEVTLDSLGQIPDGKYTIEHLRDYHKEDTISIITDSFYEKADLERYLAPDIYKKDYRELIEAIWQPLLDQNLSFAVKNTEGQVIAVTMNMDANAEPEVAITSKLTVIFEFLEYLEGPFRDNVLPKGTGQILHSFMAGTAGSVSAQQNIELMLFMEDYTLKLARKTGFAGVFTTNTSPLTQQLGTDVYGYQVLLDYQINKYSTPDGYKPFEAAPNSDRAVVSWKPM